MTNKTIYVVEDETDIASVVCDYLRSSNFDALHFADGRSALDAILQRPPQLVVLDLMLPGVDGLTILKAIRERGALPVVMLTARVEEVDRLLGLELGADDYVCKPFSPREVVARVKAVLRRSEGSRAPADAGLQLDADRHFATLDGHLVDLTRKEFAVLTALAAHPGRVYSRSQLLDLVYPDALDANERTLDSHIKNLRRKLAARDPQHEWIRSVYGVGFAFDPR